MTTTRLCVLLVSAFLFACSGDKPADQPAGGDGGATPAPGATAAAKGKGKNTPPTISTVTVTSQNGMVDGAHPNASDALRASASTSDMDGDGVLVSWTWQVNGQDITSALSDTLEPSQGRYKRGDTVTALASARDTRGATATTTGKGSITIRNSPPRITSSPSDLTRYQVSATDPDGDPLKFYLERPVPGFVLTSEGMLSFDKSAGAAAQGQTLIIVAHDAEEGTSRQSIQVNF